MNAKGRVVLIAAALAGVRQIKHEETDGQGGYCGLGVLVKDAIAKGLGIIEEYDIGADMVCPLCAPTNHLATGAEYVMIPHLNDYHGLDFLGIASKMPDTEARP